MNGELDDQPVLEEQETDEVKTFDEYNFNHFDNQQRSVMSTLSHVSASLINREDPHI